MDADAAPPFDGLRVLDLSTEIAGGYASKLLVDAGADVIVVEPPTGDPLRRFTSALQPLPTDQDGVLFGFLRASARGLTADPSDPDQVARVIELARRADVLLGTYLPGTGHWAGIEPDRWLEINPRLTVVAVSPWGASGPWADRPATEFTVQAACGGTARRGLPERTPVGAGGRLADWLVGVFAAVGALTGVVHAGLTGTGQFVDVSMLEAAALCLNGPYTVIAAQWYPDLKPGRTIEVPSIEPTSDGVVGFCTQTGQQWVDFCALIGRPDLAEDPTLRSADQRAARMDELKAAIAAVTAASTVDEVIDLAVAFRVPVTPVGNGATVQTFDQLRARSVYSTGEDGLTRPRPPYRLSTTALRPFGRAPGLGEHQEIPNDDLWPVRPPGKPVAGRPGEPAVRRPGEPAVRRPGEPAAGPPGELAAGPPGALATGRPTEPAAGRPAEPATGPVPVGDRPLAGLRVVDLSAFWAGPFATLYLAAMGADVIKVESIAHPDGMRFLGGFAGPSYWERSMVFAGANPAKRDVTLDLDSDAGKELLWRLIDDADVVIENFTPRVLERFGIVWPDVHVRCPRLILVRMPAFGLDGPWRDRAGFAMTIEQTSGLAWTTGYDDLPLVPRGPCDPVGGMHAVVGLLCALEVRRRTGNGQLLEVPLIDGALNMAAEQVLEFERTGEVLTRHGNRGPYAAPQGIYPAAGDDHWLAVSVATDAQWATLARAVGATALAADPELRTLAGRRSHHDEIDAAISGWTRTRSAEDGADQLRAVGVPAAEVTPAQLAHLNPQYAHRRYLQTFDHPVTGTTGYPGFPMSFSALGPDLFRSRPPLLGEHNAEVLASLGLSEAEIAALAAGGVIGTRPAWVTDP